MKGGEKVKRIMLATVFCLLFGVVSAPMVSAQETTIMPRYDNVSNTYTNLSISDYEATAFVQYNGFTGSVDTANITTKLQKKFFFFFWTEETTWYDTSTEDSATFTHNYGVSSGTYRIEVTYEIIGTDGTTDTITKYSEASC